MEMVLVSVATGALKPVLGKLATLLGDRYKRFKVVRKEIKSISLELIAMEAFLMKMSEEEDPDVQDKVWMDEVRELSYDMEDIIDDFVLCVDDKDTKPFGFIEKIKSSLGKMKARHRIGSEIQRLKKQIIEVGDMNIRYKTGEVLSNTKNDTVDPRAFAIFEHASKLVGISKPKVELIKLLTQEDGVASTQKKLVKMVSIVGPAGMGKTTLASQVYQQLKYEFNYKAFISVSRNPDIMNILRTILSKISNRPYADTEEGSVQQLIIKISEFLLRDKKRYFIVIDDIWKVDTWDIIKHAFPMTKHSIIITTTRINDVAKSCCSSFCGNIYSIRPLNVVHARQLFHRRLFDSKEDLPRCLEKVSDEILRKCDGLPLAIIAISGLLANRERTKELWDQVNDSIGRALERNNSIEQMIKILSLSYFDLPPHLKTCLLYLSIFPEDTIIQKKVLIWRWIAEGFIHQNGRYSAYEIGERYFNELMNRSLIQPVKLDKYDKVLTCRVHDAILDMIVSKSIEENFVTFVGVPSLTIGTRRRVRRLSLQAEGKENSAIPTGLILSHIRSLNVFGDIVEIPSIMDFSHLRAMDFAGCHQLENHHLVNIGRLFQLRYLNISRTKVSELTEQIRHLRCLQMLDLRETEVRNLPTCIVNFEKLAHLLVGKHVRFPDGIKKMQALESLKGVDACKQPCNFLQELRKLRNLRKLHLSHVDVMQEDREVIASSLSNLCTQKLCSSRGLPLNLQKLKITGCVLPAVPEYWVRSFVNLQNLNLEVEIISHEDLCILGALPALVTLSLRGKNNQFSCKDEWLVVGSEAGFQSLKIFIYMVQGHRMDLFFAPGCMPNLKKLEIVFFEKKPFSSAGSWHFGIKNLSSLITLRCVLRCPHGMRASHTIETVKASLKRVVSNHPNSHLTLAVEFSYSRFE